MVLKAIFIIFVQPFWFDTQTCSGLYSLKSKKHFDPKSVLLPWKTSHKAYWNIEMHSDLQKIFQKCV